MRLRKVKKRRTTIWSRKGRPKRTKNIWHLPKRASLVQVQGFVKILKELGFYGKSWTKARKETFNTEFAKQGYTESGSPLAPSSLRTLEALVKYLGFVYVDNKGKTPLMHITDAGLDLLKDSIKALETQMVKLQITNPGILKDCIGIKTFPFRSTLKLLIELDYLSYEEIGYLLFIRLKSEEDYSLVLNEIVRFRKLPLDIKETQLRKFLATPEGNVILGQAPTVGYYVMLCIGTDLCMRDGKMLRIKKGKEKEVQGLLKKFETVKPYDFGDDLPLWIEYYGNPKRLAPPVDIKITIDEKNS
ncbi:MAG: hypothetical protein A3C43_10575 [Candidatus Schekmanbacteria bacterium RIFCSPHIGHO2_02_FULL_38_11]|nr:MAG: hypothetical protein A3C43_10575 [Candidatus Schekmanbacteria bacterium RIFCSPHIGHO2_02_FULL_38_11]